MSSASYKGEPITIHYNGINHYNAIVPAQESGTSEIGNMLIQQRKAESSEPVICKLCTFSNENGFPDCEMCD